MSDAWGGSWGASWGDAWGAVDVAAPPSLDLVLSASGGGVHHAIKLRPAADPRIQRNNEAIIALVLAAITSGALQ